MECSLKRVFFGVMRRRRMTLWGLARFESKGDLRVNNFEVNSAAGRSKTGSKAVHIEIIKGEAQSFKGNSKVTGKGYIEIRKKSNQRGREQVPRTLSDMQEDVEELAKSLYKLRANEKAARKPVESVAVMAEWPEKEFRLASYVDVPVERISFTIRTPDRRLLIKRFTGITVSRTILEMVRQRKVRVNDVVIFDFSLVCKPMDTLDLWKCEMKDNPTFARIDRFQLIHIIPSSCYQYYTVHAIALKDFIIENWFPHEVSKNPQTVE